MAWLEDVTAKWSEHGTTEFSKYGNAHRNGGKAKQKNA